MSGISNDNSLRRFHEIAKQGPDGEVRLSKDDPNKLVNKGSLGHKISTFFENIGRALRLVPDDRKERQQRALEGFREGLKAQYGELNSEVALRRTGLIDDGVPLTGARILEALEIAGKTQGSRGGHESQRVLDFIDTDKWLQLQNDPDVKAEIDKARLQLNDDPHSKSEIDKSMLKSGVFTQPVMLEIEERLILRSQQESDHGRRDIPDHRLHQIAKEEVVAVLQLQQKGGLVEVGPAREQFKGALNGLLEGLANPDIGLVQHRDLLAKLDEGLDRLMDAMGKDKTDQLERRDLIKRELMHEGFLSGLTSQRERQHDQWQGGERPSILFEAQRRGLSEGSPLRGHCAQLELRFLQSGKQEDENKFLRAQMLVNHLVDGLGEVLGSSTGTAHGDINLMR